MPAGKISNIMFKSNIPITHYLRTTINTVTIVNLYLPHFFIFSSQTSTAPSVFRMTTNIALNFIYSLHYLMLPLSLHHCHHHQQCHQLLSPSLFHLFFLD